MPPLALGKLASMIGIRGFVAIGFAVALALALWRADVWQGRAEDLGRTLNEIKAAQVVALERALAEKHRAELKYMKLAQRIDLDAHNDRKDALADAERYIAANRVRCQAAGSAGSGTPATPGDHGTGDGQAPGGTPVMDGPGGDLAHSDLVAVLAGDVRICTDNTVRLEAARAWALELEGD